jgi:hypothetical protein
LPKHPANIASSCVRRTYEQVLRITRSRSLRFVTPNPLEGVQITEKAQKLTEAQVAKWEQSWSNSVGRLEMESVGQTWTRAEKDAAGTRALTASAPPPQMLFYRPKSNEGIFVKLRLSYRR